MAHKTANMLVLLRSSLARYMISLHIAHFIHVIKKHMWQSQVKIEHYSVAYFDLVTTFKALQRSNSVKGRAHTSSKAASMPSKST